MPVSLPHGAFRRTHLQNNPICGILAFAGLCLVWLLFIAPQSCFAAELPWKASWISFLPVSTPTPDTHTPIQSQDLPIFRHEFILRSRAIKAKLHISGLGQFEAHINGRKVGNAVLTPGWTDYRKRVFYDTYDVSAMLRTGANAIGVLLGNGMYNVVETTGRYTKFSRSFGQQKFILQLDVSLADGTTQTIVSDEQWKTSAGPITYSSLYGGEDYDARLEQKGWDTPGFPAHGWHPAAIVDGPGGVLIPENIPPVQTFATYLPRAITHPQPGIAIYDLGRNFAGWPEITVIGKRGARIKLIPGELLDEHRRVTQKSANAFPGSENSFTYVLKGGGPERWTPRFAYTGFRYVEAVTSTDKPVKILHLQGKFLHDDVKVDGYFTSSSKLFNRIHRFINRAMLSNMFSVLTDCPHREKLGWLEQTHLAGPSLMYNYNLDALYAKMADDMQDAQLSNGMVPNIAPEYPVFDGFFRDSPEWGSAVVLSPWTAYQFYGDREILRAHYEAMKSYVAYLHGRQQNHLLAYGLGDWYDIGPGEPGESQLTSKGLTATAIYFQMLSTMQRIATLLNHPEDALQFASESTAIKAAFNIAFLHTDSGQYDKGSQTANAMPFVVGLVPEENRAAVLANLVADIRHHSNHVTAGDIGFHYVVRALTESGRSDVLYDMLSRTDKPSYGDQLAHGATTLTEAWDANPNSSQNHFMLGHAEEWFYRGLAGINIDFSQNADNRIHVQPSILSGIQFASASYRSRLGKIESSWRRYGSTINIHVVIPANVTATITLPSEANDDIHVNGRKLKQGGAFHSVTHHQDATDCILSGGNYRFLVYLPHS